MWDSVWPGNIIWKLPSKNCDIGNTEYVLGIYDELLLKSYPFTLLYWAQNQGSFNCRKAIFKFFTRMQCEWVELYESWRLSHLWTGKRLLHVMKFLVFIIDRAEYAFKPKDVILNKKPSSPNDAGKLTESEIKQRINRLSQTLANKVFLLIIYFVSI